MDKTNHYRAVAYVLAGCSWTGTAKEAGMGVTQLKRLMKAEDTHRQIADMGGHDAFVAHYTRSDVVARLKDRQARHTFAAKPETLEHNSLYWGDYCRVKGQKLVKRRAFHGSDFSAFASS